jgi:hypothetical protein
METADGIYQTAKDEFQPSWITSSWSRKPIGMIWMARMTLRMMAAESNTCAD